MYKSQRPPVDFTSTGFTWTNSLWMECGWDRMWVRSRFVWMAGMFPMPGVIRKTLRIEGNYRYLAIKFLEQPRKASTVILISFEYINKLLVLQVVHSAKGNATLKWKARIRIKGRPVLLSGRLCSPGDSGALQSYFPLSELRCWDLCLLGRSQGCH